MDKNSQKPSVQQSHGQPSQAISQNLPPVDKTSSANTADINKNSPLKRNSSRTSTIYILIIFLIALSLLIYLSLIAIHLSTNVKQNSNSPKGLSEVITPKTQKPTLPPGPVSYGQADIGGITIKIDKTITSPTFKGDPPDSGMQYLEIDLTVTYTGNTVGSIPGFFHYRTGSGVEITSADVKGHGQYSNKNVLIPKKQSLYSVILMPGKTVHGVYLLYQIKPGDHGKLLWYTPSAQSTNSRQVIFNL